MAITTIDLYSVLPILYFFLSSTGFFTCVQLSTKVRLLTVPAIYGFAILSMKTSAHLSWIYQGAASYWNLMICIWMHHACSVLFIDSFQFPYEPLSKQGWILAYKIWADPQHQLDWSTCIQTHDQSLVRKETYVIFAMKRIVKIALCWFIELRILSPTISSYFQFTAEDFAPQYEPLIRRLLVLNQYTPITSRELQIRALLSIYWIWLAYLLLDGANVLLSICFVCVTRLDKPEEWKPLFGSLSSASSLRGFWGKLWHKLAAPSCASSGRLLTRNCLGMRPRSVNEKILIAFWTFLMSSIIHATAEWQAGEPVFPWREVQFWLSNFVAAALETYVIKLWGRSRKNAGRKPSARENVMLNILGYTWVLLFFFWIVPKWQYPKLFTTLTQDIFPYNNKQLNLFLEILLAG